MRKLLYILDLKNHLKKLREYLSKFSNNEFDNKDIDKTRNVTKNPCTPEKNKKI
jgi:hypothetical protein